MHESFFSKEAEKETYNRLYNLCELELIKALLGCISLWTIYEYKNFKQISYLIILLQQGINI